ncbi:ABC transporter ATP-binding protein [Leucobacter sp. CSA1]|uniref:Spermidine/putrescine import ATP-binding protein PotA n=1 Tax=Leucobacter chromiisoli TaxID=2796471 RepID=A0A934USQ6_9MICO|nr:ABC transporter ATP-binding protein [Leucobacter chromiisoli]MBK0417559.1 ABC transporter ATP-binding protein [Leucobacter chromiisoli]
MTDDTILDIHGLSKIYGEAVALDQVDLTIKRGEFLTFLGPSGSGKTTTLNLIAGFIDPSTGSMLLNDKPIEKLRAHERNLGVVFQHYALFPHMTVADNVEYPLKQRKVGKEERKRRVAEALDMVRLSQYADRYPKQLSGGQQQRVALARAVVYRPPILLMDEPLGALDKKLREWLQLELRRIHRELGSTFIYVTHDQEEALVLSDRIAVFNEGRIEQIGTAHELYDQPKTLFVGKFIGESSVFKGHLKGDAVVAGDLRFSGRGDAPEGPVAVLVRPEKLEVSDASGDSLSAEATNRVPGVIEDIVFLGSAVKYNVTTAIGDAVVRVPVERSVAASIGDKVMVGWRTEDAVALADDE